MILQEWLGQAEARLKAAGVESPRLDAQMLAAHVLLVERSWVVAHPEAEINELAAETLLQRREAREPLAYILGWREFYGRRFAVRSGVLVPRQETETLVEAALEAAAPGARVLDVGTGSGCIAITLKLERPDLHVTATDISAAALDIAKENAEGLGADVALVEADLFAPGSYDLVVSNPPYIAHGEFLMPEVADFEPAGALYAGVTGLEFYERLAEEAALHLTSEGQLLVEVGYTQAATVLGICQSCGLAGTRSLPDMAGVPRVVAAQNRPRSES